MQGPRCVLSDCCRILDESQLAPGTVVPPFAIFGGVPARLMGKLPESYQEQRTDHTAAYYRQFRRQDK